MAVVPWRAQALIVASLVFYAVAGPLDTTVFLAAVSVNWLIQAGLPPGRWRVTAAAIFNIGLIGYFKYRNLLIGDVSHAGSYLDTALPLGISFYSLQALAYHIDVARGVSKPARAFFEFFLFKAFYPQLVAGPIVRARQLLPQVQRLFDGQFRRHRLLAFGLSLIVLGLCKKIVFADSLGPLVDDIFATRPARPTWRGSA
jgi:alginate O-acetyltransferase complex protein AlgI